MSKVENQSIQKTDLVSAFTPVQLPPEVEKHNVTEVDIVDTLIIDTYETDDEGNVRPVTKQIVTGKKNRKEYIESFSDDAGLENILKKIGQGAIAEDKYSILNGQKAGTVTDLTGIDHLQNLGDIESLAAKAKATYAALDPDLKKNMTFKQFCSSFNNADLNAYVQAKIAAKEAAVGKEGE